MNIWIIVKAALITFAFIISATDTTLSEPNDMVGWEVVLVSFLFFPIIVLCGLFVLKVMLRKELDFQTQNWQSNPFNFSHPEHFFHLVGYFMIASGIGTSFATYVETGASSPTVLAPLAFGIGIIIGIWLLKIVHAQQIVCSNKAVN